MKKRVTFEFDERSIEQNPETIDAGTTYSTSRVGFSVEYVKAMREEIERLTAENERLTAALYKQAKDDQASIRMLKQQVKALRQNRDLFKNKSARPEPEVARLTAALGQCSRARAELLETLRRMRE